MGASPVTIWSRSRRGSAGGRSRWWRSPRSRGRGGGEQGQVQLSDWVRKEGRKTSERETRSLRSILIAKDFHRQRVGGWPLCVCPRAGRHHAIVGRRVVGWLLLLFALSDTLNQMHARISATLERAKRRSTTWFRLSRKCTVLHTSGMMANCTMVTAKKTRTAALFPLLDFGTHRHSVDPVIMSPMGSCC